MFPTKLVPFVFYLSVSSPVSVIHVNVDIKIKSKKRMAFLLFFISKSPGACAIYRQNARVVEMQNFTPAYIKGWTYVRTIFSEPKFIGCIILGDPGADKGGEGKSKRAEKYGTKKS